MCELIVIPIIFAQFFSLLCPNIENKDVDNEKKCVRGKPN